MKWLSLLVITLLSSAAFADEPQGKAALQPLMPGQQAKPGITIIDGKRFFSLQNAKRFNGNGPPMNNVMHHPRQQGVIVTRGTRSTPANEVAGDAGAKMGKDDFPALPPSSGVHPVGSKANPNDVLSVFAPEDKPALPPVK